MQYVFEINAIENPRLIKILVACALLRHFHSFYLIINNRKRLCVRLRLESACSLSIII